MTTYYLGQAKDGRIVSRASTRSDFTHAAIGPAGSYGLPNFSTSFAAALALFGSAHARNGECEVVEVRIVDRKTYMAATGKEKPKVEKAPRRVLQADKASWIIEGETKHLLIEAGGATFEIRLPGGVDWESLS